MTKSKPLDEGYAPWQRKLYRIIFEADTFAGKFFDIVLLILILACVVAICLESIYQGAEGENAKYGDFFYKLEWIFTILFTIEYFARMICVKRPVRYIFSFWGLIDLLAVLPTYIAAFVGGASSFAILRAIRLLRIFRVLKLVWLVSEAEELGSAVWSARGKILVFLMVVVIAVTISGAVMFELEPENFQSIPQAMYWAIVTMTTVGYGDITPQTVPGKMCTALLILLGYSLIIVPTGFVSAQFLQHARRVITTRTCASCVTEGHDRDAIFCKYCGDRLVS